MPDIILILGPQSLALAVYLVGEVATAPPRRRHGSQARAAGTAARMAHRHARGDFRRARRRADARTSSRESLRVNRRSSVDKVASKLMGAGSAERSRPADLSRRTEIARPDACSVPLQPSSAPSPAAAGPMDFRRVLRPGRRLALVADVIVSFKGRGRRRTRTARLPDALDLLAVGVEAGMGLDAALQKPTERMEGRSSSSASALGEMRIGESAATPSRRWSPASVRGAAPLRRAIIEAVELGISLRPHILGPGRRHAHKPSAAAEKAMKAPIKMVCSRRRSSSSPRCSSSSWGPRCSISAGSSIASLPEPTKWPTKRTTATKSRRAWHRLARSSAPVGGSGAGRAAALPPPPTSARCSPVRTARRPRPARKLKTELDAALLRERTCAAR